jgi:uncharacterized membrane protein
MVDAKQKNKLTLITLSPNRSATWQQTKWVIAVMFFVVMIIAVAWTFVGAWVVLPFAGAEIGLFALLMYKVSRFTYSQQLIEIHDSHIDITSGYRKKIKNKRLERADLDVYFSESENNWELPQIAFCNNKERVIIGEFLNLDDRLILKDCLENAGLIVCKNRWWST